MVRPGWYQDPWGEAPFRWWDGTQWTSSTATPPPYRGPQVAQPSERRTEQAQLAQLLAGADRIAVLDVETTGLYMVDRVVEVAVVTIDHAGRIVDEFESLVNPGRDVGPTWLHQITPSMVSDAPCFEEIAHHVAARLDGAVCAAHNLPFDQRMVGRELERAGIDIYWGAGLDTLSVTGCKLHVACTEWGVGLDDAHRALADARATAQLLLALAEAFEAPCAPATARPLQVTPLRVRTRDGDAHAPVPEPYLAALARGVHATPDVAPYVDLLDAAISDLQLTPDERAELRELAGQLGLDEHQIRRAHRDFLNGLIDAALEDSVITDDEYDQLSRAAALLDIDADVVHQRTDQYRSTVCHLELRPGLTVCFTGTATTVTGEELPRDFLEEASREAGLRPVRSVTASECDLLVAADTNTRSAKAEKARRYGVPVAAFTDFLEALNTSSPLRATRQARNGTALVCADCGVTWLAARRSSKPHCSSCRKTATALNTRNAGAPPPASETLTCSACGSNWERTRVRGRKPTRCPSCAA